MARFTAGLLALLSFAGLAAETAVGWQPARSSVWIRGGGDEVAAGESTSSGIADCEGGVCKVGGGDGGAAGAAARAGRAGRRLRRGRGQQRRGGA